MESAHNYQSNMRGLQGSVRVPGAAQLRVTFDPRCHTESGCDYLEFSATASFSSRLAKYEGRGTWAELTVQGSEVHYRFRSDSSQEYWGYKFEVSVPGAPMVCTMHDSPSAGLQMCGPKDLVMRGMRGPLASVVNGVYRRLASPQVSGRASYQKVAIASQRSVTRLAYCTEAQRWQVGMVPTATVKPQGQSLDLSRCLPGCVDGAKGLHHRRCPNFEASVSLATPCLVSVILLLLPRVPAGLRAGLATSA